LADIIALIGGETLLGHEVREVFGESSLGSHLRLIAAAEEEAGKLTEIGGSAAFITKLDTDAVEDAAVIVLAGSAASSKEALAAGNSGIVIDLTGYTEEEPDSQLRSPLAEGSDFRPDLTGPQVVAHASATAIAVLLSTLNRSRLRTRERTRPERHRRVAAAGRQPVLLSADAEEGVRRPDRFQPAPAMGRRGA
jgi:hypothetical protein